MLWKSLIIHIAVGIHWPFPVSLRAKLQFSVNLQYCHLVSVQRIKLKEKQDAVIQYHVAFCRAARNIIYVTSLTWDIDQNGRGGGCDIDIYAVSVDIDNGVETLTFLISVEVHQTVISAALFDQFTQSLRSIQTSNLVGHQALNSYTDFCGLLKKTARIILYLNVRMAHVSFCVLSSQTSKQEIQMTRNTVCKQAVPIPNPLHVTLHSSEEKCYVK